MVFVLIFVGQCLSKKILCCLLFAQGVFTVFAMVLQPKLIICKSNNLYG